MDKRLQIRHAHECGMISQKAVNLILPQVVAKNSNCPFKIANTQNASQYALDQYYLLYDHPITLWANVPF